MRDAYPYQPPLGVNPSLDELPAQDSGFLANAPIAFVVLPIVFGLAGFVGYILLAIALEVQPTESEPVLSHGQQAFLLSLPICTIVAASTGGALAFALNRKRVASVVLLLAIAFLGWMVTRSLWNQQIAQYGRDASEIVLYYPPAGFAAAAAAAAILLSISPALRLARRG